MREVFQRAVERGAQTGQIGWFVDKTGITEDDRERLSALRQTAEELGYEVGNFVFSENAWTAMAPIKKISK